MSSEVDVYNFALSNVGISTFVSDVAERTNERLVCSRWFAQCRDQVLRDFPWPCATKAAELSALTDTFPGWQYVYQYPSDCVRAGAVTDTNGTRLSNSYYWAFSDNRYAAQPPRVPYRVALTADGNGQVILTDLNLAWLIYTARVTVVSVFQADLIDALSWKLGSKIALPLQAKADMALTAEKMYQMSIQNAWANALNESVADARPDSPSIAVR